MSRRSKAMQVLVVACALGGSIASAPAALAAPPASAWSRLDNARPAAPAALDRRALRRTDRASELLRAASARSLVSPLASGSPGTISGKVTAAKTGEPLAGVEVCAFGVAEPLFAGCADTNALGEYLLTEVTPGSYEIEFFVPFESHLNYVTQYYDGASTEAQATPVEVTPGGSKAGVDAALVAGGTIAGKVTNTQSEALEGIEVCALDSAEEFIERCATTAANGEYELSGLAAGEHVVEFAVDSESDLNYAPQYYDDKALIAQAEPVPVKAEATTEPIDASLSPGGEITGTVVSSVTHAPLAGVLVCAAEISPGSSFRCASAGAGGEYKLSSLAGGSYEVEFLGTLEYEMQFYKEASSPAGAIPVQVTQGAVLSNIDAALLPSVPEGISSPTISGSAVEGQRLTLAHGAWTNAPTSFLDEWGACGSSGEITTCHTVATGESFLLTAADVGHTIRVREYASNVSGRSEFPSYSTPTAIVVAPAPVVAPIASASPATGASGVAATQASAPSKRQLEALLLRALTPSEKNAKIAALLRNRGYRVSLAALAPGRVAISWFAVPSGKHAKRVLVASGRVSFTAAGAAKLTIKLTVGGRALLERSGRLRLTASGTIVTPGASTVALTKGFVASR